MFDVRTAFARASDRFARIVGSVNGAWDRPTPCELSLWDVVEHVVGGNEFAVRLLAGAGTDEARSAVDAVQLGGDPARQIAISCAAQTEAFARADRMSSLHHPVGDIDYGTFVTLRLGELVVHGWDIAVGAGLDPALDPDTAEDLWTRVEPRRALMLATGSYGPRVNNPLPSDASVQDKLLTAFGRSLGDPPT